jgi:peptide/nickel transport system substrate-binding protein
MRFRSAAVLALAIALTACARTHGQPHVLRIADSVDPSSLNPLLAHDQDTIAYDLLVTQTLVGLSAKNALVPVLVTRVPTRANGDISPDGKTIVYHLKPRVTFADGVPLTSKDVAFTYRAILDPRNPVLSADAYRRIERLETPNPSTVVIRLHRRWNAAVAELFAQADFAFGILPAHAFASTDVTRASWNELPFGTGPFRVTQWERGNRIVLDPNPYYRPVPKLHRIELALIPSTQASLVALQAGGVDVALLDPAQLPDARRVPGVHVVVTPLNGLYMLTLQVTNPPTDDVTIRQAIAAALDRSEIVRGRYDALKPADSFLPPVFGWYDPAPEAIGANRALVARLLHGRHVHVTIALESGSDNFMEVMVQAQLQRVGIDASLKPFPATQFNAPDGPLRSGRFAVASDQWIGAADPEESVIFACSQRGSNGNNSSNYCSPQFDALFADQATATDDARRRRDFIAMQRIVRSDVPIVPIAFEARLDAVSNRVTGFGRNMLMFPVSPETWDVR